jgi:hypothetical protein
MHVTNELLISLLASVSYWRTKWEHSEAVYQLFIGFKKSLGSDTRKVLHILTEFGIPMEPAGLIKMCLNETYSKDCTGKHLCNILTMQTGLKQRDALLSMLLALL